MAVVRYYFDNHVATVSPAFSTSWDNTGSVARSNLLSAPGGSNASVAQAQNTGPANRLVKQFISSSISGSNVISGTVKGQFLTRESTASMCSQIVISVFSSDGLTNRGVLLDVDNSALSNEFTVGLPAINRKIPRGWSGAGTPIASLLMQDTDRIVVEIGFRSFTAGVNTGTYFIAGSATNTADLPEDETSQSTTSNSWIEFSSISAFDPNATPVGHPSGAGTGIGTPQRWLKRRRTWTPRG